MMTDREDSLLICEIDALSLQGYSKVNKKVNKGRTTISLVGRNKTF